MPTIRLTQRAIETLKPPAAGRVEYWDSHLPGFGLRVARSGRKTWVAMYRVDGKLIRETVGTLALIPNVAEARDRALGDRLRGRRVGAPAAAAAGEDEREQGGEEAGADETEHGPSIAVAASMCTCSRRPSS